MDSIHLNQQFSIGDKPLTYWPEQGIKITTQMY